MKCINNQLKIIEKRFQISNYLSVAQMYLKDNVFLENKLMPEHLKPYVPGHFGVSPAVNFIYAHINAYAKRKNKDIQYIIGEGHAGSALLANLFLDGKISKYYEEYPYNTEGLTKLIKTFGTEKGFRTEINPYFPSTIYDGGELGYSLATTYGAALNKKNKMYICIIGDGEAETGTISASWFLNKLIDDNKKGNILPILNLNGFKMGSESIFSKFSDKELTMYFEAIGYTVYIVDSSHIKMYETLEKIDETKNNIIILKSSKGWTGINNEKIKIEGNIESHKNPLEKLENIDEKIACIEEWLKSYKVNKEELENLLKDRTFLIDNKIKNDEEKENIGEQYDKSLEKYEIKNKEFSNIKAIAKMINDKINDDNNFYVFSPDELESNYLKEVLDKNSNNVIEILNENICQALYFGHTVNCKQGIMVSYEAFMPIITSMVSQYEKYLYQLNKIRWRKPLNSMIYVLTSVCWENNYSHQNPEFLSSMLMKEYDFVNVYTPMDANSLVAILDKCLKEKNKINVISISKRIKKQYNTLERAKEIAENGIEIFYETKEDNSTITLVAIGDYLIEEVQKAKDKLEKEGINVRIVYITKINALKELNESQMKYYFGNNQPILIYTHTYANIIKGLLHNLEGRKVLVEGYKDKSDVAGNHEIKLLKNGLSCEDIYMNAKKLLKENCNE